MKIFIFYIYDNMGNLFTVVDENDTIVGYKSKADIDPEKEYYRVSALRLVNSQGDILIAQRAFTKSHNPWQRWPAVAGTIEKGESYEENIIKEIKEELWISDMVLKKWPKHKITRKRHYFGQRFFGRVDKNINEFTIQKEEVEAIKWISPKTLQKNIEEHPEKYLENMKKHIEEFSMLNF